MNALYGAKVYRFNAIQEILLVSILPLPVTFELDFEIVPTMWYFLLSILFDRHENDHNLEYCFTYIVTALHILLLHC
jgi:hypothetical protein